MTPLRLDSELDSVPLVCHAALVYVCSMAYVFPGVSLVRSFNHEVYLTKLRVESYQALFVLVLEHLLIELMP